MTIEKHDTTENTLVPVSEKYTLTIKEAASYFNIGTKKMRRLAEDNRGRFAVFSGNRYLIIRPQFENLSVLLRRYNSVCLPKVVDIISVQSDI